MKSTILELPLTLISLFADIQTLKMHSDTSDFLKI